MRIIGFELTNRCNLRCHHCFSEWHGGRDDLDAALIQRVLAEAHPLGFTVANFTGGEPTLHRQFWEIMDQTCALGYKVALNSNGWNFPQIYTRLLTYREHLHVVTFSMDGASQAVHEQIRGKGAYHRVLQAISICVVKEIPFTINMVVTAHNRHEIEAMAQLAAKLGARSLRYGHLMHSPATTELGWDLAPQERKQVEATIWQLRRSSPIPITMAAGSYTTDLFPCQPLQLEAVNIDCRGKLTKCCMLSAHGGAADVIDDLEHISFGEAYQHFVAENEHFHQVKQARLHSKQFQDADFFPCWYCANHYQKVDWLKQHPAQSWAPLIWKEAEQ